MVFQKIKIQETSKFGRIGTIYTKKGRFQTPNRSIIQTKLKKFQEANRVLKKRADFFKNPFLEVVMDFSTPSLKKLHTINGIFRKGLQKIRKDISTFDSGPIMLFPRMRKDSIRLESLDLEILVDLQGKSGLIDLVGIPDPRHGTFSNEFKELMQSVFKRLDSKYPLSYPMPFIRLDQDRPVVENKIKWLLEQDLGILGFLLVGDPQTGLIAVEKTLKEGNVWIHLSNVRKELSSSIPVAIRNIRPLDGFDTVSAWKGYGSSLKAGPSDRMAENVTQRRVYTREEVIKRRKKAKSIEKSFTSSALGFLTDIEYEFRYGADINCPCPICNNGTLDSRNDLIRRFKNRSIPLEVHETVASTTEITDQLRIAIGEHEQRNYLLSKALISEHRGAMSKYLMPGLENLLE